MSHENEKAPPRPLPEGFTKDGPDVAKLQKATDELRLQLEAIAARIRTLIIAQPPTGLLGYLWTQFSRGFIRPVDTPEEAPDDDLIKKYQLALEYVHAVWSCHDGPFVEGPVNEEKVAELMAAFEELDAKTFMVAMASSASGQSNDFGDASRDMEFHAKSSWHLIRGHRYQVLKEQFFRFVLAPHDEALKAAYSVDSQLIAAGIQAAADSFRMGYGDAMQTMAHHMGATLALAQEHDLSPEEAMKRYSAEHPTAQAEMSGAAVDMFYGGICNLSRKTKLPTEVLRDMAYAPGEEKVFFAPGPYAGTPLRSLPARVRPLLRLSDGYYATDGQFVRDSAYRAIQRGVITRVPAYSQEWGKRQAALVERAFPNILQHHLQGARVQHEVFFKDPATGQWVETDTLIVLDDVLLDIEAKAGVMAMQSPAINYESHIRTIRNLVLNAHRQCSRFITYLASSPEVPTYRLENGRYIETARLRQRDFRRILPIGLTTEAFTPFSSMCKVIPEAGPILGLHPFISMSVDDLFVMGRLLRSGGELLHYLSVRQAVAGMPDAMMFDEIDHLGAYIARNRFDLDMREQLKEADKVSWDAFCARIDRHFEKLDWETTEVPHQTYPAETQAILDALNHYRPSGWLAMDAHIRDFDEAGRENLAAIVRDLKGTLAEHGIRRMLLGTDHPVQIWLTVELFRPTIAEVERQAEIACLVSEQSEVPVLTLRFDARGAIAAVACAKGRTPPVFRADYGELVAEGKRQRAKFIKLEKKKD